jgi:hypothetical protein
MLSLLEHAHAQQARVKIDGSIHVADAEHGVKNTKHGIPNCSVVHGVTL